MMIAAVVAVDGGLPVPIIAVLANTIGGEGEVVEKLGNKLAAVGTVPLPVLNTGCVIPATEGGTAALATAGPTSGPIGTATGVVLEPVGGKVG